MLMERPIYFFMRSIKNVNKPLVAIEVKDGRIMQSRGKRNNVPTRMQKAFINKWEKEVLKGSMLYA